MTPRKTPVPAATEKEDDTTDENDDNDDKESMDEDSGESNKEAQTLTPGIQSGNSEMPKQTRKAPLVCKVRNKTRFPMIVKPDCSSQGKGIFLTNDIDKIPKEETYVVQQYM